MSGRSRIVSKGLRSSLLGLLLASSAAVTARAAEEPAPTTFVSWKFEGACDAQNQKLWLSNEHEFKTIAATVRWRAAGGKDLSEVFYLPPKTRKELGCAAEAEIADAQFADF